MERPDAAAIPEVLGPVLVVIPTYDERETLQGTVARVRAAVPDADVLVVDDASPDGTGELADALAARDGRVHVLHRQGKDGLGPAYLAGFAWALARDFDVVVEMDADGSHLPEQLPSLLAALATHDLVIGARWLDGGRVENWSPSRQAISRVGNAYARFALGTGLRDATSGYRAFRAAALRRVGLDAVASQGYCFQIDLARRAVMAGLRVAEVPITFVERVAGRSKMSRAIVLEAMLRVTGWGAARLVRSPGRAIAGLVVVLALLTLPGDLDRMAELLPGVASTSVDFQWSPTRLLVDRIDPYVAAATDDPPGAILFAQRPSYLALLYVLLVPYALLPWPTAALAWALTNVLLALAILVVVARATGLGLARTLLVALLFLGSDPVLVSVQNGQQSLLVLAAFLLAIRAERTGAQIASGIAHVKYSFSPALLALLVARGGVAAGLRSAIAPAAGLTAASLWLWRDPTRLALGPFLENDRMARGTFGFGDLMTVLGRLGAPRPVVYVAPVLVSMAIVVVAARRIRDPLAATGFAALVALATTVHLPYDYVFVLPALVIGVVAWDRWEGRALVVAAVHLLLGWGPIRTPIALTVRALRQSEATVASSRWLETEVLAAITRDWPPSDATLLTNLIVLTVMSILVWRLREVRFVGPDRSLRAEPSAAVPAP